MAAGAGDATAAGLIVEGYAFDIMGNVLIGFPGAAIASIGVWLLDINVQTTLGNIIAVTMGAVSLLALVGMPLRRATNFGR